MRSINKRISICFVLPSPVQGGAERFFFLLLKHLSREHFDITLVLFHAQGPFKHLLPGDIRIIDLNFVMPPALQVVNLGLIHQLSRTFKTLKPDLIFTTLAHANLLVLMARKWSGVKASVIIRETVILSDFLTTSSFGGFKKWLCQRIYPLAECVVSPSKAAADDLKSFIRLKGRDVVVISNAIDADLIDRKLSSAPDFDFASLKSDKAVVVSVGRLESVKGFDRGIRAFVELNKKIPCYYWILGDGRDRKNLEHLCRQLGVADNVFFLGFQSNPYHFMKKASIFFLPSRAEGFPNVLLETMYVGLPCITSRFNESMHEIVQDRVSALIADFENPAEVATKAAWLIENEPLRTTIVNGSKTIVQNYSVAEMTRKYERLFMSFITVPERDER